MSIQYPWALLLLALIPAVLFARRKYAVRTGFSSISALGQNLQPGLIKTYSPYVLAGAALILIVLAIANVQYSSYWQKTFLESKWIMLVQDLSGSMGRFGDERGRVTLGDVALEGAHAFIDMRNKDDLIGIISFSNFAQLIAPPSFDKDILTKKLELLSRKRDSFVFRDLTVGGATNASYAAWLAVCVFFMFLPEENQPSYEQINDLRYALMGKTVSAIAIPDKLKNINFGQGMAIVLFTDGRIEANGTWQVVCRHHFLDVAHHVIDHGALEQPQLIAHGAQDHVLDRCCCNALFQCGGKGFNHHNGLGP